MTRRPGSHQPVFCVKLCFMWGGNLGAVRLLAIESSGPGGNRLPSAIHFAPPAFLTSWNNRAALCSGLFSDIDGMGAQPSSGVRGLVAQTLASLPCKTARINPVPLFSLERLRVNRDTIDLRKLFLHAVFQHRVTSCICVIGKLPFMCSGRHQNVCSLAGPAHRGSSPVRRTPTASVEELLDRSRSCFISPAGIGCGMCLPSGSM